jgi:hypothetical protein
VLVVDVSETEPVSEVAVEVFSADEDEEVEVEDVVVGVTQVGPAAAAEVPGMRRAAPSSVTAPSQPSRRSISVREW